MESINETVESPEVPVPSIPGLIGRLTPEEETRLRALREETAKLLQKIGEHEVLKARLLARVAELEQEGQGHVNSISRRLNVPEGQQWVCRNDGMVLLISPQGDPATS